MSTYTLAKPRKGTILSAAIHLATTAHNGQYDRGGNPYILHPLRVMSYIKLDDEELQCIAVLHDVVEDCAVTWNDLYTAGMTERIVVAVRALTKMPGQSYDEYKAALFANSDAMRVKLADLRHNTDIRRLKGVSEKDIARIARYHELYLELSVRLKE